MSQDLWICTQTPISLCCKLRNQCRVLQRLLAVQPQSNRTPIQEESGKASRKRGKEWERTERTKRTKRTERRMERMESQQIAIYFYQQIANGVSKAPYVERIGTPSLLTMTMPRKLCLTVKPNLHISAPRRDSRWPETPLWVLMRFRVSSTCTAVHACMVVHLYSIAWNLLKP